jgi:hypothetical protein
MRRWEAQHDRSRAIARPGHARGNLVDGASAHVAIARTVGVHAGIGIRGNADVLGIACAEWVVERSRRSDHGSILVVADPMTLPHLSRVPAAIAGKELVAIGRPDDFP